MGDTKPLPITTTTATKPFWQSKTFWTNIVMGAASFIPAVKNNVTPDLMAAAFTGVNVLLRFVSNGKITIT
jgi:hypothetical protein